MSTIAALSAASYGCGLRWSLPSKTCDGSGAVVAGVGGGAGVDAGGAAVEGAAVLPVAAGGLVGAEAVDGGGPTARTSRLTVHAASRTATRSAAMTAPTAPVPWLPPERPCTLMVGATI